MRAVQFRQHGDPSVLEIREIPTPTLEPDHVRVRVAAVALNPFDYKVRRGYIHTDPPTTWQGVGSDLAGTVEAVGEAAAYADGRPIRVGDDVIGWADDGALAELVSVPAGQLAIRPAGLSWDAAAAIIRAGVTAMAAADTLDVGPGDVVLVSSAAGSMGEIFCQLARSRGARVIGTASPKHHDRLRGRGVEPVAYGPGLTQRVTAAAAPDRVTAVQDNHGGETIDTAFELGVPPTRICTVVDYAAARTRGVLMPRNYDRSPGAVEKLAAQVADGQFAVTLLPPLPLERVREAFELLESQHPGGKIIIHPQPAEEPAIGVDQTTPAHSHLE
ncbi:NADP-dependent oxidoreductase [Microbacterium sp. NPDC058062]|uniref:NADP-dependent oxidoreductase n=1 Tax=Microbacterium sp. NPDC058062 TaxID=3346320 RepID=UPI0036D79501